MIPTSIRWRLPFSYALIALLATLALGTVLLTTLRGYYAQREHDRLTQNASTISHIVGEMVASKLSDEELQSQIQNLAFISQTRIRVLDTVKRCCTTPARPASNVPSRWDTMRVPQCSLTDL